MNIKIQLSRIKNPIRVEENMKKIILSFSFLLISTLFIPQSHAAVDITNNYKGYVVENQYYEDVEKSIKEKLHEISFDASPLKNVPHAYYESNNNDEHYYVRFYPANKNANIYIVSDKPFSDDEFTNLLDTLSYKSYKLEDKIALKEYKYDFIELARNGAFNGFFVMPDYVKPLKTRVSKVNTYINNKYKKEPIKPYAEDSKEINLTLLDTKEYNNDMVSVISKEYRLKNKENKYVHAFEYIITNKTQSPVIIKTVSGESVATLRDIESMALSDLDRINLLDTMGTLLSIPTAGASLGLKVPNYMRIAKITKEAKRFTKGLPQNQTIEPKSELRILTMKYKSNPKPLDFTFEQNSKEFKVSI